MNSEGSVGRGSPGSRRRFLAGAGALLAAPLLGASRPGPGNPGRGSGRNHGVDRRPDQLLARGPGERPGRRPHQQGPALPPGLFSLGVASGDPLNNRVVLWTRLAPEPLAGGGMPEVDVPVRWEVSLDESFRRVVRRGTAVASPRHAHSVHVDVVGLRPDSWYHYRFLAGDEASPVGRTRTAPPPGRGDRLRFLFASCQNWQQGFWPAWAHAADEDVDLVVFLGDYIYEGPRGGFDIEIVRFHNGPEVTDLGAYRNRYGLYKGDPALQAAHAAFPFVVTWDDHEVDNNYAGLSPENPAEAPGFAARRAAAYKAWWEHQPVRMPPPTGPDLRIHRSLDWGRLVRFHVLDGRQYRSDQPCGADLGPPCPERTAPDRTMLGADQEAWLGRSLRRSHARWDVLANQVVMTAMPLAGGAIYNLDQWDGYAAARTRLYDRIRAARVENAVVVTGDIHAAGVADLVDEHPDGTPMTESLGTELVGTSISSSFPPELADVAEQLIAGLPHIHFADVRHRGYTRCEVDRRRMVAAYRQVASAASPESPISTGPTFTIESGSPVVRDS